MDSEDSDLDVWKVATGFVSNDWLKARRLIRMVGLRVFGKDYRGNDFHWLIAHKEEFASELAEELIKMRLKNG